MSVSRDIAARLKRAAFRLGGRKPWSRGHGAARDHALAGALSSTSASGRFTPPPFYGIAMDERVVEYPWLLEQLPEEARTILDAGSALNNALILDHLPLERLRLTILTLAPEANCFCERGISYHYADFRDLPFRDGYFDCVVSVSSLEHVGMNNAIYTADLRYVEAARRDYLKALAEFRRVLKPGAALLVTVPYGRDSDMGWFQQFGREALDELVRGFGPATIRAEFFRYRADGWKRATQDACDDAEYHDVRQGTPNATDLAAAARAVACLKFVKEEPIAGAETR